MTTTILRLAKAGSCRGKHAWMLIGLDERLFLRCECGAETEGFVIDTAPILSQWDQDREARAPQGGQR